jgi:peptidyl-dipeptidase Dcp
MTNPFFTASTLPFGLPPFAEIADEHYRPGFDKGFTEQLAEIERIVANADAPTFENTFLPLERSGRVLDRVSAVFYNQSSADSSEFTNDLEEEIAPLYAAHHDAILLDARLFTRIDAVYRQLDALDLDPESRYLVERYHAEFTIAGAGLSDEDKQTLRDLNTRLSGLTTRFEKNLLADTNDLAIVVDDVAELDGLGAGEISAAAQAAAERGLEGKYLLTLVLPTGHPYLSSLTDRGVREHIMTASRSRGARDNEFDNRELVLQITALRAERARLLGFDSHAAYVTADQTAKTPQNVFDMLGGLAPVAARNARAEQKQLQTLTDEPIEAWDWAFYSEKVRKATFDVDTAAMRPYFEAERALHDGVFFAATRL